ncbi:MAG: helix-turn-helix transcriptional regulator [Clostridia bacterium]|nr:helix-turn-helix transcriptional regulator [Clostridia bacterium]
MAMELRETLASNLLTLRKARGLTQLELAEQLNYSDKSVSKWERGDAVPDVEVLARVADFYGVTVDYLIREHGEGEVPPPPENKRKRRLNGNRLIITLLATSSVWIISTIIYVQLLIWKDVNFWMAFLWSVPASCVILIIFKAIWGRKRYSVILVSVFLWSLLTCIYLQAIRYNVWSIYFIGVPLQISIILSASFKRRKK